jgi:ABC-type glycerol-3-phosphate transport system substrate-binding protein
MFRPVIPLSSTVRSSLLLGLLGVTHAACHRDAAIEPAAQTRPSFEGISVRLAVPGGLGLARDWAPVLEDWASDTGGAYTVTELPGDRPPLAEALPDERGPGPAETVDHTLAEIRRQPPTLMVVPTVLTHRLLAEDRVAPIPEPVLRDDSLRWSELSPPFREALGMLGDRPAVVPLTTRTLMVCVRRDLLEQAGRVIPARWEDYSALLRELADWAPGLTALEPRHSDWLATLLLARALGSARHPSQYSVELDVSTGEVLLDREPFVRALAELQQTAPLLAAQSRQATPADCWQAMLAGTCALAIVSAPLESDLVEGHADPSAASSPTTALAFGPLPGSSQVFNTDRRAWEPAVAAEGNRPGLTGFGGLSVCVSSTASPDEQLAAWDLWGLITAHLAEGTLRALPGDPCLPAAILRPRGASALDSAGRQSYQSALLAALRLPIQTAEIPCGVRDELRRELSAAVAAALDQNVPPRDALAAAARRWQTVIDAAGRKQVVSSYRQRLGLTPAP